MSSSVAGGMVTPASTMRSRNVRSMKPPDSPPCSPKAERWESVTGPTTSTSAMWVAGPTNVIVSPSSTCTSPPSMATVTRSPTRPQVCAACAAAQAPVPQASVWPAPRSHTRSSRRSGPVAAIHSTLMPPSTPLLDERPVGVDVDGQHVVHEEHEVGVAHVDGDRPGRLEHELPEVGPGQGLAHVDPGRDDGRIARWPPPGPPAGRRRWRSAASPGAVRPGPTPGPGSGCRCRSSRRVTRRR